MAAAGHTRKTPLLMAPSAASSSSSSWASMRGIPAFLGGEPEPKPTGMAAVTNRMTQALAPVRGVGSSGPVAASTMLPAADSCCPNMSFKDRVKGCIGCVCVGIFLSLIGWFAWVGGRIGTFAFMYTLGNITSLCSTGFLIGPKRQCRQMFKSHRVWATCIYLFMMLATVIAAFAGAPKILILLFIVCQWGALVWYIASYIPYGRKIISKLLGKAANSVAGD